MSDFTQKRSFSDLDMQMFYLTVWFWERQKTKEVLKNASEEVLGDTDSLAVSGNRELTREWRGKDVRNDSVA